MICPSCGKEAVEAFLNDGIEIKIDYTTVLMSAHCYFCKADIYLEYTCSLCEVDEEV